MAKGGIQFALVKSSERDILERIQEANADESSIWKIPNIWIPIFTIALTLLIQAGFGHDREDWKSYVNVVLNGALPLIAINQISGIGLHVFKFEKGKEKQYGIHSISFLRTKLLFGTLGIFAVGVIGYAYQAMNFQRFSIIEIAIQILLSTALLILSSIVSKNIFLLQEEFIDNTFEKDIVNEAERKHGRDW